MHLTISRKFMAYLLSLCSLGTIFSGFALADTVRYPGVNFNTTVFCGPISNNVFFGTYNLDGSPSGITFEGVASAVFLERVDGSGFATGIQYDIKQGVSTAGYIGGPFQFAADALPREVRLVALGGGPISRGVETGFFVLLPAKTSNCAEPSG
jgi:hypothetical protein